MLHWRVFVLSAMLHVALINGALAVDPEGCGDIMKDCTLSCPYDYAKDSNNCTQCSCYDPCKNYDCGMYEVCEVRVLPCADLSPCPPRAVCVPPKSGTTTRMPSSSGGSTDKNVCLLDPQRGSCEAVYDRWFFNVTSLTCQMFEYGGCEGNGNNFITQVECLTQCLRTSVACPDVPCTSPCQLQYDSKGCNLCVCPGASCRDVECDNINEECKIVDGQCSSTSQICYPEPKCVPKTVMTGAPTPPRCPYIDCELMICPYGIFKSDAFGCKTCSCYDPCENYECPAGKRCAVMGGDCGAGSQCRDPPMAYCTVVVETQPPVTRARTTAENLMSCCMMEKMSNSCLPLCRPDLAVSSPNVPTLLACTGELTTYLKCAGEGKSYTSCCSRKGVVSSCFDFCAGNASIDTTNLHVSTDCIMSGGLNDVISCFLEGQPDQNSLSTLPPTLSVTSDFVTSRVMTSQVFGPEVCRQSPDSGPCDSVEMRWFFNPSTLMCEVFQYGGCGGNTNNFLTKLDCMQICMADEPPPCPDVMCATNCEVQRGADGCNQCVCSSYGMSATQSTKTTAPRSASDCCYYSGVSDMCMRFCNFDFNFGAPVDPRLLECQQYLNVGIECAMRGMTYGKCCESSGVIGQCLEACRGHVNISDVTCLLDGFSAMLSCFANEQTDNKCPPLSCQSNSCPYGTMKDSNGCHNCSCFDPCQGVECKSGTVCKYKQYADSCTGDICEVAYRGECSINCGNLDCAACEFGYVKDVNDCPTCECYDPCKNVTCSSGETCVPKTLPTLVGTEVRETFEGECRASCPDIQAQCHMYCNNGHLRDSNGCEICACYDPCKNMTCDEGLECQTETIEPTPNHPYSVIAKCLPHSGCHDVTCTLYCLNGLMKDDKNCPVCKCYEPCAEIQCDPGFVCKTQPTTESDNSKYNVKGVCTFDHCTSQPCNKNCTYGFSVDNNGCPSCTCADPCKNVTCDSISVCQPMRVMSKVEPPFEYTGQCIRCTGMVCDILCDYGVVMLTSSCPLCECYEPCKNNSCTEFETCEVKRVNVSADNLQSHVGQCVSKGCPSAMCSNFCQFGRQKSEMGCETCECFDPCKDTRCLSGMVCEARNDPSCLSGALCTRPPLAVCVPPSNPCARQQQVDYERYSGRDSNSAQLNCDMNGNYKPLQCVNDLDCRCSAPNGMSNVNGLTRDQAIALCYPEDKIMGLMRLHADIAIIEPGRGSFFKQNMSKQLADLFGVSDSNVTITQYRSGSILMDFVVSTTERLSMDMAENTLLNVEQTNQMIPIEYNGQHYFATMESFERIGPYKTSSTTTRRGKSLTRTELLIIVIVIPVVCAILIGLLIAFCVFKFYQREKPLISESVRSSMSFDNVMEKGTKAGYENPTYDNSKVRSTSANFSSDATTA